MKTLLLVALLGTPMVAVSDLAHNGIADAVVASDGFAGEAARQQFLDAGNHFHRDLAIHRLVVPAVAAPLVGVQSHVFLGREQLQVLRPVIEGVPVDVVDVLALGDRAADLLLNDPMRASDVALDGVRMVMHQHEHVTPLSFLASVPVIGFRAEATARRDAFAANVRPKLPGQDGADRRARDFEAARERGLRVSITDGANRKHIGEVEASIGIAFSDNVNGHTAWTSARSRADSILEGFWQSCPDNDDSSYGERVYVWRVGKSAVAEIHLGERDEFAVFRGEVDGERNHASAKNLLGPAYHYDDVPTVQGGRNWSIGSLGLHLNVIRVDGSYSECYSYVVLAVSDKRTVAER